ncbi:uncharacterized protein BDW70DRAFT_46624 [Aspergillus foveolatus]|uniref:uncharacterized protein n=1 Tax=Aspergillus foveolatus TaxID=210207 RepID=UPI003CCCBC45
MNEIKKLPEAAEFLRKQARTRIMEMFQGDVDSEDDNALGKIVSENKKVKDDELLSKLVSDLKKELEPGKGWGWNLNHFSESIPLINNEKRTYIVPLSKGMVLTPDGPVIEGHYAYITDSPTISSNSTAIFITPFPKPG